VKLFFDENISPLHARKLRGDGYDAVAVVEAGLSGASDERILDFAVKEDRILVTLDADFANVLRFPAEHTPGLVRLRLHPPTEEAIRDTLRKTLLLLKNIELRGRLAIVEPSKIRIRPRFAKRNRVEQELPSPLPSAFFSESVLPMS
jgi:predicted nuclease of predicted toxin-antitoxin system